MTESDPPAVLTWGRSIPLRQFLIAAAREARSVRGALIQIHQTLANARRLAPERPSTIEARLYVRAALDPAYVTDTAVHGLVRDVMRGREPGCLWLSIPERAVVAAGVLRGWSERPEVARG